MSRPAYVAIAGPIGVGKTTLAQRLAERWGVPLVREQFDRNPFLAEFYRRGHDVALATELYFLWSRFEQLRLPAPPGEAAAGPVVTDYLFAKGPLFAAITLTPAEQELYGRLWTQLNGLVRQPDAVIYLTDSTDRLIERIHRRGRPMEQGVPADYVDSLRSVYERHFAAQAARVLALDCRREDVLSDGVLTRIEEFVSGLS